MANGIESIYYHCASDTYKPLYSSVDNGSWCTNSATISMEDLKVAKQKLEAASCNYKIEVPPYMNGYIGSVSGISCYTPPIPEKRMNMRTNSDQVFAVVTIVAQTGSHDDEKNYVELQGIYDSIEAAQRAAQKIANNYGGSQPIESFVPSFSVQILSMSEHFTHTQPAIVFAKA